MSINNTSSGKQYSNVGSGSQYNAENITINHETNDSGDKDRQFVADLKLSDPRLDKERIERTKGGLWKDSYLWILDNEDFQRWRAEFQNRLLWIRGDPGKGKTMLLCGIIQELQREKSAHQPFYFFCQATDSNLNTASAVLRGILFLILKEKPQLVKDLRETYDYCDGQLFEGSNGWDALCSMITRTLRGESLQNAVIVVDALDECIFDIDKLLEFLNSLSSKAVRVLVSSRNWPTIERGIAAATQKAAHISLELNEYSISAAVVTFINHKVEQLAQKHDYCAKTRDMVYKTLVERSNNTFLWAALVCQQLADNSMNNWEVKSKLHEFPPGLDLLYARMLNHALTSTCPNGGLYGRILAVASVVYRPVDIAELMTLLGPLRSIISDAQSLEKAVKQCGSFLTVRDNIVYFVHQSAKDFLLESAALREIMPQGIDHEHRLVWKNSLQVMSSTLRHNIYDLQTPSISVDDIQPPVPDPLAPVRYSCIHWIDHFNSNGCNATDEIENFFKDCFLHWAEALCLLRSIYEGIGGMTKWLEIAQVSTGCLRLFSQLRDAVRFLQHHRQIIEKTPMQLYCSILLFSPRTSFVRTQYLHEVPDWILTKPLVKQETWNARLQTLGRHEDCKTLRFSPAGCILASTSSHGKIGLWDVATGRCLRFIKPHDKILGHVEFSHDELVIAAALESLQCAFYSIQTGDCLKIIQGYSEKIRCIAISQDGRHLAMGSEEMNVKLWDIETSTCIRTFRHHNLPVVAVVFAPDGRTLASAASSVKIWNMTTGESVLEIQPDASGRPSAICYLQEGRQIACTLSNRDRGGDIAVWETSTGQCLRSFKSGFSNAVQISPYNGGTAASDWNGNVELWNLRTGVIEKRHTIDPWRYFHGVALSNDGRRLATVEYAGIISLWDLTITHRSQLRDFRKDPTQPEPRVSFFRKALRSWYTDKSAGEILNPNLVLLSITDLCLAATGSSTMQDGDCVEASPDESEKYDGPVHSINFSIDGQQIVSVRQGYSPVEIWDAETGKRLRRLRIQPTGNKESIYLDTESTAAFTTDHKILLAAERNMSPDVQIWDATAGSHLRSLRGCGPVTRMVFSADTARIAIIARNEFHTVRIWSSDTGQCVWTFNLPEKCYWLRGFLQSGSKLHTSLGVIDLSMLASQKTQLSTESSPHLLELKSQGYHIEKDWIMKDRTKMMWLPEEYWPWKGAFASQDSTVALGCRVSGGVIILRFA